MPQHAPELPPKPADGAFARFFQWWHHTPLYLRILGGVILGVVVGLAVGHGMPRLVDAILPPESSEGDERHAASDNGQAEAEVADPDSRSAAQDADAKKQTRG